MKIRKPAPLVLLLLLGFAAAEDERVLFPKKQRLPNLARESKEVLTNDEILKLNKAPALNKDASPAQKQAAVLTSSIRGGQSMKPDVGTKDAPVDGLDGKPHAGPWVDTTPEEKLKDGKKVPGALDDLTTTSEKALPTSLQKLKEGGYGASSDEGWQLEDIPEKNDGVMDDPSRPAPKKGTTGTEGGVSEKEKERKAKGNAENKPQEPKEAPPLPHSEQEHIELKEKSDQKAGPKKSYEEMQAEKKEAANAKKKGGEYGEGGYGMEKPKDLPEKPHDIPHPAPKGGSMPAGKDKEPGPPPDAGKADRSHTLVDTMPYTEGVKKKPSSSPGEILDHPDEGIIQPFHSYILSLTMILFSEIGDKTFLVAALMAMRHPRLLVFTAAFSALIAMTILSAVLGHAVPSLLPARLTAFAAACLFLVFGAKMLREGLAMPKDSGVGEEMKEVEAELEEKEHLARRNSRRRSSLSPYLLEAGRGRRSRSDSQKLPTLPQSPPSSDESRSPSPRRKSTLAGLTNLCSLVLSPAWVQTFIMTFLGEWGDRSQIATIAMAAGQDYWWVTLGAVSGHAFCTGIAVIGGRALAGRVSLRVVTLGGAMAFLVFGVIYSFEAFYSD